MTSETLGSPSNGSMGPKPITSAASSSKRRSFSARVRTRFSASMIWSNRLLRRWRTSSISLVSTDGSSSEISLRLTRSFRLRCASVAWVWAGLGRNVTMDSGCWTDEARLVVSPGAGAAGAIGTPPPCSRRLSRDIGWLPDSYLVARGRSDGHAWRRSQVVLLLHVVEVHDQVVVCLLIVSGRTQHHFHVALLVVGGRVLEPLQYQRLFGIDDEDDVGVGDRRRGAFCSRVARGGHQRTIGGVRANLLDPQILQHDARLQIRDRVRIDRLPLVGTQARRRVDRRVQQVDAVARTKGVHLSEPELAASKRHRHHVHHLALFDRERWRVLDGYRTNLLGIDDRTLDDGIGSEFPDNIFDLRSRTCLYQLVRYGLNIDHRCGDLSSRGDIRGRNDNTRGRQLCLHVLCIRDLHIDHDADKQRHQDAATNQDETQSFPLHAVSYLSPAKWGMSSKASAARRRGIIGRL